MPELFLSVGAVIRIGLGLLSLIFTVHLVRTGTNNEENRWFVATLAIFTVVFFLSAGMNSSVRAPLWVWIFPVIMTIYGVMVASFAQFIYVYLGNSFPTEKRVVRIVSVLGVVFITVRGVVYATSGESAENLGEMNVAFLTAYIWIFVLVFRKHRLVRRTVGVREAHALAPYFIVLLLFFTNGLLFTVVADGLINPWVRVSIQTIIDTAILVILVAGNLHFSPTASTVQVKLVGITLGVVLIVLATTFSVIYPLGYEYKNAEAFRPGVHGAALSFQPLDTGGYSVDGTRAHVDITQGNVLESDGFQYEKVEIGFPFTFYGVAYDSVHVDGIGDVAFADHEVLSSRTDPEFSFNLWTHIREAFDDHPRIAVFAGASNAESIQTSVSRSDSSMIVTWESVPENRSETSPDDNFVVQIDLYISGEIQFRYSGYSGLSQYRGLYPGDRETNGEHNSSLNFSTDLPWQVGPREPLMETLLTVASLQRRTDAYPLLIIMIVALLLVLGTFPLLFRTSILSPLNQLLVGVQSVNAGELDTSVPIQTNDEIGQLTGHFNEMTTSLRGATRELEDRVARRTAELSNSLEDLHATQAQLVEQEKLASLGALTAGIAHEIKNPLNFVNNFAEVSEEMSQEIIEALKSGNIDEARELAAELGTNSGQIAKHGRRADSIVKSMMQHARGGTSEMESIEVNTYLEEYINLAWHGMRARDDGFSAEVKREFDPAVGSINAMPQELGRVILNLLNNAFDAIRESENATVTVATRALDGAVEVTVSDSGPGIPIEIREKIFEPFFTTKATGEGTGLGLSLSHDIITKGHGGKMEVGNSASGGAMFTLLLPTH
jgi:signal transduction histidine kinase